MRAWLLDEMCRVPTAFGKVVVGHALTQVRRMIDHGIGKVDLDL